MKGVGGARDLVWKARMTSLLSGEKSRGVEMATKVAGGSRNGD